MFGNSSIKEDLLKIVDSEEETEENESPRHYSLNAMADGNECTDCWFCSTDLVKNRLYCAIYKFTISDPVAYAYGCANFSMNGS